VRRLPLHLVALLAVIGCDHTAPFSASAAGVGPFSSGDVVRLTFNSDQDYWPTLTEDGSAVLYAYVDTAAAGGSIAGGLAYRHRCIGLLPVAGGTRFWQWCDNRPQLLDSLSSFPTYAVGRDGRLIYLESTSARGQGIAPEETKLWLADTAFPFRRRALLTLPAQVGDSTVSWLADLRWTGPNTFLALAQHYLPASHCIPPLAMIKCPTLDTIFMGEAVVRGTITSSGAALTIVPGTDAATSYDLAENGASIIFTQRNRTTLFKVPSSGGAPVAIASVTDASGAQLLGLSCGMTTCVVATAPISPWAPDVPGPGNEFATINLGTAELRSVSIASGAATVIATMNTALFSCPLVVPATGNIVVQVGRDMGHLQTWSSSVSDLYLYKQ
jgi:hypothetical protein